MRLWLLLLFLVACGDDGGARALPDAPFGRITVTVRTGDIPVAGATVYVQSPSSELTATVMTDASGVAMADGVVAGSTVTVRNEGPLMTILDVQPNDDLLFVTRPTRGRTQVPVQVPSSTQATLHRYLLWTTCGVGVLEGTTSGVLNIDGCTTADILVDVQDSAYDSLEFAYAPDQSLGGALDLSALVYMPSVQHSFSITNAPEVWRDLHPYRTLWTEKGQLYECDGFSSDLRCPTVTGTSVIDRVTAYDDTVWHASFFPATSSTSAIDFAGLPIETIPDAPAIDLAANTVSWTGGAGANIAQIALFEGDGGWLITGAAPSDGRFLLPRLPDGLEPFAANVRVELMLLDVVGGYAAARQRVFATETAGLVTLTGERVIAAAYAGGF
jgi:hypothetical protein